MIDPRRLLVVFATLLALSALLASSARADEPTFRVRYRSADTVYLDAGRDAGLSVGDRLEVLAPGVDAPIALLEVVFTARQSASCRVLEQTDAIEPGALVRPLGELAPPAKPAEPSEPSRDEPVRDEPVRFGATGAQDAERPRRTRRRTRLSGLVSVDRLQVDESPGGPGDSDDFSRDITTARLSLRGRDLGGLPLDLRVRLRSRSIDRGSARVGVPASESRDRLDELSLLYRPRSERWGVQVGRLGVGTFTGVGPLDGVSGHVRLASRLEIGGFYGSLPDLTELGFETGGAKYGVFTRLVPVDGSRRWEVFVAGLHEEDDLGDASGASVERELVVLETRLGGGSRWQLYQRAELALDTASSGAGGVGVGGSGGGGSGVTTGDGDESGGQLTQLSVVLNGRLSESRRLTLSYDLTDPILYAIDDDLDRPTERFDDLLRQGVRARLHFGRPGATSVSITGGVRTGDAVDDDTVSVGLGVYRPQRSDGAGLSVGGDLLAFSNAVTEGALVTLRARRGFSGGHSLGLSVGSSLHTEDILDDELLTSWARLTGWVELPLSLFARGEVEVSFGDEREGQRVGLGLGYRF